MCCVRCPPRTFLPALCKIFLDATAPDAVLEVTARALTYYLDVSVDCSRRIVSVDGALKAIIARMEVVDMGLRSSRDLAEQCVKVRHPTLIQWLLVNYMWKVNAIFCPFYNDLYYENLVYNETMLCNEGPMLRNRGSILCSMVNVSVGFGIYLH